MGEERWAWLGKGGGELGRRMRDVDWEKTPVGPVEGWPPTLKSIVAMLLHARHPMFLWWGPDLVQFYNDGYVPSFGVGRHPSALGQRGRECWAEIWGVIGPEIEGVVSKGVATFHEDALVPIFRNGRMEEVYWTYGYSPVFGADGAVAGVLVVVTETTSRVIAVRRLRTERTLAELLGAAVRREDLARSVVSTLDQAHEDSPWSVVVRTEPGVPTRLVASSVKLDPEMAARVLSCASEALLRGDVREGQASFVDVSSAGDLPGGPWPESSTLAVVLPLGDAGEAALEHLVVGVSPRLPYDPGYASHVSGVARQVTAAAQRIDSQREIERRAVEREKLVADLEAASRAKDEFLAMMGHELRNPLSPIVTALAVMADNPGKDTRREQAIIGRHVEHLVRLMDDLLDVSRIIRGKVELRRTISSVSAIVGHAVEVVAALFENRRHALVVTVEPDLWWNGDATRLEQVLSNLLTNAARYTEPGGKVQIAARSEGEHLVLSVRDNGKGIGPELMPHVFEPFVQGGRGIDRREGGLGLGLAVVKGLVELHGGTVAAESDGPGRGSEFRVRVPGLTEAAEPSTTAARPAREPAGRSRVLVVDDNQDGADMLAEFLTASGYEVEVAHDGPEALAVTKRFDPSVAILDIGLPVMDGYELVTRLREQHRESRCRYIALTGYGQQEDVERARAAGFERLVVKPVDPNLIRTLLVDEETAARPAP